MNAQEILTKIIRSNNIFMNILRAARELNLPDWFIAGGAPRNLVWEHLYGKGDTRPWKDIDMIYFDDSNLSEAQEKEYQAKVQKLLPSEEWDVVNQARVHLWKTADPVKLISCTDAISRWLETATCIGVKLEADDSLTFTLPLGAHDLLNGIVRKGPNNPDLKAFNQKLIERGWLKKWPKLKLA